MRIVHVLAPRTVPLDGFDAAVAFHEELFGEPARLRLELLDGRLRIAQVASMLFTAAEPGLLPPAPPLDAVYVVRGLDEFAVHVASVGAEVLQPVTEIATGRNMVVRHPDGGVIEYVEHAEPNPQDDVVSLAPGNRAAAGTA
jgi:predicted enzyme related to lactoylglutathione lyase